MRITEVRHSRVPLRGNISNAVVNFSAHDVSLVAVVSDVIRNNRPVVGVAFNSIGRFAQPGLLNERFIPRLTSADQDSLRFEDGNGFDPDAVLRTLMANEKPGGHGDRASAVAAIELAIWDLNAKLNDEPAAALIARTFSRPADRQAVPVYAAGGYYRSGNDTQALDSEIASYVDQGYSAFKIKIGGAPLSEDLIRIESVLQVVESSNALAVDANGRFDLQNALAYATALDPYELGWYEEPGDPLDYSLNAQITDAYSGALATGENLFSVHDTRNLVRHGGMRPGRDIFQMDAGLSYGLTEYAQSITALEDAGHQRAQARPHGGHLINLHIVHGLELGGCEAYPGVFEPFGGYSPHITVEDGQIAPTDAPGFGLEQKPELIPHITKLTD